MKRNDLITAARSHIGTPWAHMGRDTINGLDCGGFLFEIAKAFNVPYEDHKGWYPMLADGHTLVDMLRRNLIEIPKDSYKIGSIIVVGIENLSPKGRSAEFPQHVCMVTETGSSLRIVHSCNKPTMMKVIEHGMPPSWLRGHSHSFDYPGVED